MTRFQNILLHSLCNPHSIKVLINRRFVMSLQSRAVWTNSSQKPSKGGFGAWLFHREPSNPHAKSTDPHMVDQSVAQPTGRAVHTPSIPEAIPRVVSIKAGEGPADAMQEYGVRRVTTPAPTLVATAAVPRQPQSSVQVLQQPQVYDKQSRDVPRTVARTGEGPADYMQEYWMRRTTTPAPTPAPVATDAVTRQPQTTVQLQQPQVYDKQSRDVPRAVARAGEGPADYKEFGVRRTTTPAPAPTVATDAVTRRPQSTVQVLQQPQVHDKQSRDVPRAVARAGEGLADYMQEYGVRRTTTPAPAPAPVAIDAVARQPQSSVQVPQQPQVYDKQFRDVPRTVARAGEGPADYIQESGVRRTTTPAPAPVATDAVARQPQSTVQVQQPQVYDKQPRDIPRTVTRAGEGNADYIQEYGVRRTTTPAPAPVATDAVARQPQSTVQVQQPQVYDKQFRDVPRTVARAGEGPVDYIQDYGVRRTTTPAPAVATDAVARQLQSTVQVQQPQAYDKQPRDVLQSRTVAGVQLNSPSHPSSIRVSSPQPWVQPAQWSTEPEPMSPLPRPPVVPSPVVFHTPLASPPTLADTQQLFTPPRSVAHGHSSHQESSTRDIPWHSSTANGRQPAPPVHSHTTPLLTSGRGQRVSSQGTSPAVHEVGSSKHARSSSMPVGYTNSQPSYVTSPQSRPIAPGLAAAFPIREDNVDMYRQLPQGERPHDPHPSKDALDNWDRHRHNLDNVANAARVVVSTVPSNERTPRSTKASPNLHPRPVNQGTPPKPPSQPFDAPTFPPQSSTNPNVSRPHDSFRPGVYNTPNQNLNTSPYPATSIYPSPPRAQIDPNSPVNNPPVANASTNNPSPKIKSGNPSPRSRSQIVASSQGATPPVAVHITTRTPSHETGSTTLLGQTPSSQESASLHLPMSPPAHQQAALPRVTPHGGQQTAHASAPVSDSLGDRNVNATSHTQVPTTRQSSARHHHSNSVPVVSVPSLVQSPPPVQSQMQPPPRPAPLSPTPVRSYPTPQTMGDFEVARTPFPGYSPSVLDGRQQRDVIPSPSQESELNTPSSLAVSTKLPIVSDEPLAPVMSTQSLQEPKKKGGFFQGLGLFRSKSSAQKRHPHESKVPDSRAQTTATTATMTKQASHKSHTPLHYDSDSKVVTTPVKLKKSKPVYAPVSAGAPKPPQLRPIQVPVPAPSFAGATEEKFSSAPNAFASFRIISKRYRTMSGASAEAVDGTNAGVCPTFSFYFPWCSRTCRRARC